MYRSAGFKKDDFTNFRPSHGGNLSASDHAEILSVINSRQWDRIDLIGEQALRITGKRGISKWRGSPLDVCGQRGLATYDPLWLMRNQEMLLVAANDLKKSLIEPEEHYTPFPSIDDVREFKATTFAFDIECPKYKTMGDFAPVELVGLCAEPTKAMVVPVRGEYISELRRIFLNAEHIIGHNAIQFDCEKLFPVLGLEW